MASESAFRVELGNGLPLPWLAEPADPCQDGRIRAWAHEPTVTRWNLTNPDETDRLVRGFLARLGMGKGDLSESVGEACRREVLRRTVAEVQGHNADLSPVDAMRLAEKAVAATRAARS